MDVFFANTGVQYLCVPLKSQKRFAAEAIGMGWQRCQSQEKPGDPLEKHFIQWQLIQARDTRLFLAVDTTSGPHEKGFFCSPDALIGDFPVRLTQLLDVQGKPLEGVPAIEFVIRPPTAGAGAAKAVHLVVDFGNSRTGGLLIEHSRESEDSPLMEPFELVNRYVMDAWNGQGEFQKRHDARWFSSRTHWCTSPYLPPPRLETTVYAQDEGRGGLFGRKPPRGSAQTVFLTPRLFQDLSAVRLGTEADDVTQTITSMGEVRTGVSSPKRYLWADDESWLEGSVWFMADPTNRGGDRTYTSTLQGPLLGYLPEDDADELDLPDRTSPVLTDEEMARMVPHQPRHAPRALMVAALYELLCQAYTYANSFAYRERTHEKARPRELHSLTLTFPSGMIREERDRFRKQADKAAELFYCTLGRSQTRQPSVTLSIDEASAVHLTYIWSELQLLDKDPRLWFDFMGRGPATPAAVEAVDAAAEDAPEQSKEDAPAAGYAARRRPRPNRRSRRSSAPASPSARGKSVRIACIDIGGGTSDLMIASYTLQAGAVDLIEGQVLHRDGISLAGDQLVKRLLERIIVPEFADSVRMTPDDVDLLFGPELGANRSFRAQRIGWVNRLFVPLASAYLKLAVDDVENELLTHTDPELVAPEVVDSLQEVVDKIKGQGKINVRQPMNLAFDPELFEEVVAEVFDDLLFDFCERITEHRADVVLLAGQPTKLKSIQDLVQQYLALPASRIVPTYEYYAGNWYPYQNEQGRDAGIIVDPKSTVVVGAAVESLMAKGKLGGIQFVMKDQFENPERTDKNHYHWGLMTRGNSKIRGDRVLFRPDDPNNVAEFPVVAERVLIGRRLSGSEAAEASPVWILKVDPGERDGRIQLKVTIERTRDRDGGEESVRVTRVEGTVADEPAELGRNVHFRWRTLADDRYYLDTGALDNIQYD